jgi:hypothetical protein
MNEWEIAALVLAVAIAPCLGVCFLAGATHGLAALEVASTLLTTVPALTIMALASRLAERLDVKHAGGESRRRRRAQPPLPTLSRSGGG